MAPDGTVYVADNQNQAVRKIYPNGTVTTLATAPGGVTAQLLPNDVAVDAAGDLYLTDASQSALLVAR